LGRQLASERLALTLGCLQTRGLGSSALLISALPFRNRQARDAEGEGFLGMIVDAGLLERVEQEAFDPGTISLRIRDEQVVGDRG
jgi:hypothetical protein